MPELSARDGARLPLLYDGTTMIGRITLLPLTEPPPTHWRYEVTTGPIAAQRQRTWPNRDDMDLSETIDNNVESYAPNMPEKP